MTARTGKPRLYTIGHGRLPGDDLTGLLRQAAVEAVVDVRRYPASRRNPQFARAALDRRLTEAGIGYRWVPDLGGRRSPDAGSPHRALRVAQFRAYADHMEMPAFRAALDDLLRTAAANPTAVLCAESVWWRCHRRLIADAAMLLGSMEVTHLLHGGGIQPHMATEGVRVDAGRLVYDGGDPRLPGPEGPRMQNR